MGRRATGTEQGQRAQEKTRSSWRKHRLERARLLRKKRSRSPARGKTPTRRVARKPQLRNTRSLVKPRPARPQLRKTRSLVKPRRRVARKPQPRHAPKPVVKNREVEAYFKYVKEGMNHASGCKYTAALNSYNKAEAEINKYRDSDYLKQAKNRMSMQNKLRQLRRQVKEGQVAQNVYRSMPNVPKTVTYKELDFKELTLRTTVQNEWNALRHQQKRSVSDYRLRSNFVTHLIQWGGTLQKLLEKTSRLDCRFTSDRPRIQKRLAAYQKMKSTLDDSPRPEVKIP